MSSAITTPTSGPFYSMLKSYFGNYQSDVQQAIWTSFLEELQLQENPVDQDVDRLFAFSQYVHAYYENLLPPDLLFSEKTKIIFSIFDILIRMMETATTSQITSQKMCAVLTKKQEEYRQMMAKTVLYVGQYDYNFDGKETKTYVDQDPSKFILGYGNFTVQDIFDYLVITADANYQNNSIDPSKPNTAAEFKIGRPPGAVYDAEANLNMALFLSQIGFSFSVQKTGAGSYQMGVQLFSGSDPNASHPALLLNPNTNAAPYIIDAAYGTTPLNTSSSEVFAKLQSLFYSVYNRNSGKIYEIETGDDRYNMKNRIQLSWPNNINYIYLGDDKDSLNEYSKQAGLRGESNKREQSSIDSTKSRIDILKDFISQQKQLVSSSSTSKGQVSNLYQSIIRQMQNILNTIFK